MLVTITQYNIKPTIYASMSRLSAVFSQDEHDDSFNNVC
jgi:hypothetical protein